jgi:cytochrome c oxidase subunit 2
MAVDSSRRTLVIASALAAASSVAILASAKPQARVIKVIAKKFEFVPREIRVKRGETVSLQLSAPEVPMGFNLADFKLRTDVMPGKVAMLEFTPDRTGTFTFLCDVFCGSGHEDMSGTLVVV